MVHLYKPVDKFIERVRVPVLENIRPDKRCSLTPVLNLVRCTGIKFNSRMAGTGVQLGTQPEEGEA